MSENGKKYITALILICIALFSMLFTIYAYIKYPENRETFIKRLENARTSNIFREIREMRMKKGGENESIGVSEE
ncbi:MAG: hypothetical protein DSY42_09110 [Aquifex sp.]|nr:MAG: hypothetical protein DSY42_09110 [Aquifex sp.]